MKFAIVLACLVASVITAPSSWRVVGGSNAAQGQFPYQISLHAYGSHLCGGSILDETTILCAAHCVVGQISKGMTVRVGNNKLSAQTEEYEIAKLIPHKSYDPSNSHNDISIIKLQKPIQFRSGVVEPVKLPTSNIGVESVTLSGWGYTSSSGSTPNDLQFIKLETISLADCKIFLGRNIVKTQVCTLTQAGEGFCSGDSGGPLVDSRGSQIGIVSYGVPCAESFPDVFTRVYSYLDWIEAKAVKVCANDAFCRSELSEERGEAE